MATLKATVREIQRIVGATVDGIFGPETARKILAHLLKSAVAEQPPTDDDQIDDRTARNLSTLHPEAQRIFRPFIVEAKRIAAAEGVEYVAISGTRSKSEQDALYAKGRTAPGRVVTNARWPYSNHNHGIALDFGVFRDGVYLDSAEPSKAAQVHRKVGRLAPVHGLTWGGNWTRFRDFPHFEVDLPLSTAERVYRLKNGVSLFA